jgi:hypothetical protein
MKPFNWRDYCRNDEAPEYYDLPEEDETEELAEEDQCPDCGAEISVEGTTLVCSESCGWFEEHEEEQPILGEG